MSVSLPPRTSTDMRQRLRERIASGRARVGVIGLGYVGLPLAVAAVNGGYEVVGIDTDPSKVTRLNAGRSYLHYIPDAQIAGLREIGRFVASGDFAQISDLDVITICVPTPLSAHREPDLSFITRTADNMAPYLRSGQLVVLESTTYPGTTLDVLCPRLERAGLVAGEALFLAYSPEREDPGNRSFNTSTIPKVVGGQDSFTTEIACAFFRRFIEHVVPVSSPGVAEAVKLTENIFRAVNIALVNELKIIYEAMGIDIWEVIDAAKTKPFGFLPFYPGPGLGGHCIPIDPFYLTWKAREYGISTRFIELAGEINTLMPGYVVERLARALDARFGKGLNGAKILITGVAYKKNIDDTRESPALTIIEMLEKRGATVVYHDPYVPTIPRTRRYPHLSGRRSLDLASTEICAQDAAVIVTDHDKVAYEALVAAVPLVVDTRNATRHLQRYRDKICPA
jgi:UDP-N-acetyl-D-glucosamine dehydrogenase